MKRSGFDDKAGRAEAALQSVVRHERLLHRVQPGCSDSLDGYQRFVGGRLRRQKATHDGRAVEQDGTGAADPGAADQFGAGEAGVADNIDQQRIRVIGQHQRPSIDSRGGHFRTPALRSDFFADDAIFAGGAIAPAISIRSIVLSCFRNASTGCMEGNADLVP